MIVVTVFLFDYEPQTESCHWVPDQKENTHYDQILLNSKIIINQFL